MNDREKIVEYMRKKARNGERVINCIEVASELDVNYDLVHKTIDELIDNGSLREIKL